MSAKVPPQSCGRGFFLIITRITTFTARTGCFFFLLWETEMLFAVMKYLGILLQWNRHVWTVRLFCLTLTCSINWKCKVIKVYFIFRASESTFAGASRGFPICSTQWESEKHISAESSLRSWGVGGGGFALTVDLVMWSVVTASWCWCFSRFTCLLV